MCGNASRCFVGRHGPVAHGPTNLVRQNLGCVGVTERFWAGQDVLGVVRDVIGQRMAGHGGNVGRVDEGHFAVSGGGDDLAAADPARDGVIAGEVLHEPRWAQHGPLGHDRSDEVGHGTQTGRALRKRRRTERNDPSDALPAGFVEEVFHQRDRIGDAHVRDQVDRRHTTQRVSIRVTVRPVEPNLSGRPRRSRRQSGGHIARGEKGGEPATRRSGCTRDEDVTHGSTR